MSDRLLVDTTAWSLAFRRDRREEGPVVNRLRLALERGEDVVTTGLVLQELLHGLVRSATIGTIVRQFRSVDLLVPTMDDHIHAAEVHNRCQRGGVQATLIDALLAALCISHDCILLSTDRDFAHMAKHIPLRCWEPAA